MIAAGHFGKMLRQKLTFKSQSDQIRRPQKKAEALRRRWAYKKAIKLEEYDSFDVD